ncbi:MAG: hypothetical protein HFE75_04695 [Firmicutes bacterium]|nr:hypothetical protein [Bacillota bacterium]NBI61793.1 hypothetical protein [Clostridiales bacterium]
MKHILAAVGLQLLIVIGFVIVLGLLRSYFVNTCLRTLEQETQETKGKGGLTAYLSKNAEEYLYTAYEPVGINDWFVLVTVPESVVLRDVDHK